MKNTCTRALTRVLMILAIGTLLGCGSNDPNDPSNMCTEISNCMFDTDTNTDTSIAINTGGSTAPATTATGGSTGTTPTSTGGTTGTATTTPIPDWCNSHDGSDLKIGPAIAKTTSNGPTKWVVTEDNTPNILTLSIMLDTRTPAVTATTSISGTTVNYSGIFGTNCVFIAPDNAFAPTIAGTNVSISGIGISRVVKVAGFTLTRVE